MDEHLQQLKREAVVSGDYAPYEAALARTGKKRLVLRRLTVAHFGTKGTYINTTLWSDTTFFFIVNGSSFTAELTKLAPGYVTRGGWDKTDVLRVLDIETKELVVPTEYLEHPSSSCQPVKQETSCADGNPCYLHGCVPCLNRGSIHPDTFPCSKCDGQLRLKYDNATVGEGLWLWRDTTSPDDTCTCDPCYHPGYGDDWRMRFCDDCGGNVAGLRHGERCMNMGYGEIPTNLNEYECK